MLFAKNKSVMNQLSDTKMALAPVAGASNVSIAPPTAFDAASVTFAWIASPNGMPTGVVCGVPGTATMETGPDRVRQGECGRRESRGSCCVSSCDVVCHQTKRHDTGRIGSAANRWKSTS